MPEEAVGDLESMMELSGLSRMQSQNGEEKGLAVCFTLEPMQNEVKTREAGRPIFDDVEICEIRIAGSLDKVREVVNEGHRRRFHTQYLAFKRDQDQDAASGTPLTQWPLLTKAQCEEARYFGVRTVEQLSEVPDGNMQRLGGGWPTLRQQARDWLAKAQDGALKAKLRAENDALRARMDTLEAMLKTQAAALQNAGVTPQAVPAAAPPVDIAALVKEQVAAALAVKPKRKYTRKAKAE